MKILISFTLLFCSLFVDAQDVLNISKRNLIADMIYFNEKVKKIHPNPYYLTSEEQIKNKIESVIRDSSQLTEEAILTKFMEIVASIGDGHTNIYPFDYYRLSPVRFIWIENDIFLSGGPKEYKHLFGSRLEYVEDVPVEDVVVRISNLIPGHESINFTRWWTEYYLRVSQILYGLNIIKTNNRVTYTFETKSGGKEKLLFIISPNLDETPILRPYSQIPMYYETKGNGLWFDEIGPIIYFHFSEYPKEKFFRKIGREIKSVLEAEPSKPLLIDLRRNGGGDLAKGRRFIDIIKEPIIANDIKVYVAIGKSTYSAAVINAVDFKKSLNAEFLGEISAGRPNGYSENNPYKLPNTGILGSISSIYYNVYNQDTPGLIPDIEIKLTWELYAQGRDPILEYLGIKPNN